MALQHTNDFKFSLSGRHGWLLGTTALLNIPKKLLNSLKVKMRSKTQSSSLKRSPTLLAMLSQLNDAMIKITSRACDKEPSESTSRFPQI